MNIRYIIIFLLLIFYVSNAEETKGEVQNDSLSIKRLEGVVVYGFRIPESLKLSTSATSIVYPSSNTYMARKIAVDEALMLVPGVRIDNQANGSRIHMSIRGQGILTERGLRGIKVMIDGITINDPSGFVPDLYDVDWENVDKIEIMRGPSASIYGGGGAAGVLNITTEEGGDKPFGGKLYLSGGSNGFSKLFGQIDGSSDNVNYRISASRIGGNGWRDHSGFWGDNISEKLNWAASDKLKLTQILSITDYFNQNAEGLSLDQLLENPKQANPDARPFNEYQKTNRVTNGIVGSIKFSDFDDLQFSGFVRWWKYKETSNKAAQYREFTAPGGSIQYNMHFGSGDIKNHLSVGTDFQWQAINENKFRSLSDTTRQESMSQDNLEDTVMLANQVINQGNVGAFLFDKLNIGDNLDFTLSVRYDNITNELIDKLHARDSLSLSGNANFDKVTAKIGAAYSLGNSLTVYADWGQGFMPPATEELASNPASFGGFNKDLQPATSVGEELGFRGFVSDNLFYDVTGFYMTTDKDFFRFKLYPARGNQEVFYGNAGSSKRYGLEAYVSYTPVSDLYCQAAYTYSHFRYDSPDSLNGVWVPNSPEHQLTLDVQYEPVKDVIIGANMEMQSKWTIYADSAHQNLFQDGYHIFSARLGYNFMLFNMHFNATFYVKNIGDVIYMGFTEPDPDGNCYQPAPGREYFLDLRILF